MIEKIIDKYCQMVNFKRGELFKKDRSRNILETRQILFYILIEYYSKECEFNKFHINQKNTKGWTIISLKTGFHHSTIMHSFKVIENLIQTYPDDYKFIIGRIKKEIDLYLINYDSIEYFI